jgi:hypothetical protein
MAHLGRTIGGCSNPESKGKINLRIAKLWPGVVYSALPGHPPSANQDGPRKFRSKAAAPAGGFDHGVRQSHFYQLCPS